VGAVLPLTVELRGGRQRPPPASGTVDPARHGVEQGACVVVVAAPQEACSVGGEPAGAVGGQVVTDDVDGGGRAAVVGGEPARSPLDAAFPPREGR
jgi:hypothetical protein